MMSKKYCLKSFGSEQNLCVIVRNKKIQICKILFCNIEIKNEKFFYHKIFSDYFFLFKFAAFGKE